MTEEKRPPGWDEAISAASKAINDGPLGVIVYVREIDAVLAAAWPVLAAALADHIEKTRDANYKERTELFASADADVACEDTPHWECHAVAAYAGYSNAVRIVRAEVSS